LNLTVITLQKISLWRKRMCDTVYHYTSLDGVLNILREKVMVYW